LNTGFIQNYRDNGSDYSLRFSTWTGAGLTEHLVLRGGNVGIGTDAPARTLDLSINGKMTFGNSVITDSTAGIYWHSNDDYGIYRTSGAWSGNGTNYQQLMIRWYAGIILNPSGGQAKSHVGVVGGMSIGDSYYETKYDNGLIVQGNVGIGTDSPDKKLHILGSSNEILHIERDSGNAATLKFSNSASVGAIIGLNSTEHLEFSHLHGTKDIIFKTNNTERIRINSSGNVGIGTNNPASKLEVNGNIIADSILHSSNTLNKTSGPSGIFFAKVQTNGTDMNVNVNEMTTRNDTSAPNCVVWNVNDAQWGRSNISKSTIDTNTYDLLGSNSTSSNLGDGTCIRIKITGLYEISFSIPTNTDVERANPCISVGIADSVNSTATGAYYDTRMYASNGYIRDYAGNNRSVQVLPPIILQLNQNQGIQVRGRHDGSGWGNTGNVHVATDGNSVGYLYIKRIA
jgi:hypothetical protein